jgi:hypothetical protein
VMGTLFNHRLRSSMKAGVNIYRGGETSVRWQRLPHLKTDRGIDGQIVCRSRGFPSLF